MIESCDNLKGKVLRCFIHTHPFLICPEADCELNERELTLKLLSSLGNLISQDLGSYKFLQQSLIYPTILWQARSLQQTVNERGEGIWRSGTPKSFSVPYPSLFFLFYYPIRHFHPLPHIYSFPCCFAHTTSEGSLLFWKIFSGSMKGCSQWENQWLMQPDHEQKCLPFAYNLWYLIIFPTVLWMFINPPHCWFYTSLKVPKHQLF